MLHANLNGCAWLVVDLFDQRLDVCRRIGHGAGLQRQQAFLGGFTERLLEDFDVAQQLDGVVAADIEESVGCGGRGWIGRIAGPIRIGHRNAIEGSDDAFDDVVDLGEVASMMPVVVHVYRFARENAAGKFEQRHVGSAPWTVHREKP